MSSVEAACCGIGTCLCLTSLLLFVINLGIFFEEDPFSPMHPLNIVSMILAMVGCSTCVAVGFFGMTNGD